MATTAHVGDALRDTFKGNLALRGLNLTQGFTGLMRWANANPDDAADLIRAYLDGKDAGTRASKPAKQPGGPRSARRKHPTRPASGIDAAAERLHGIRRRGTHGKR